MSEGIVSYCKQILDMTNGGTSMYKLLLEHGKSFAGAACPDEFSGMPMKYCFCNSVELMSLSDDLTYCEGIAVSGKLGIPMHHAWCIDSSGKVVDGTWETPETSQYFGIPLRRDFVLDVYGCSKSCASVLDNWDDHRIYTIPPAEFLASQN